MAVQFFSPEDFLILVVDDYADNLKVLRIILEQVGYRLTFARSGAQALERVATVCPDLILLDLMMPDMDGLKVCTVLQETPDLASIPIIFLTASHEIEHLVNAFKAGAVDYITKPFSQPELLARVRTHLELKHLRDRMLRQVEQERVVSSITHGIHHSLNLSDVLHTAASELLPFLKADRVWIGQFDSQGECRLRAEASFDTDRDRPPEPYDTVIPLDSESSCLTTALNRQIEIAGNPQDAYQRWLAQHSVQAELRVPIYPNQECWGVLIVHRVETDGTWSTEEVNLLGRIVDQLAIAIQHSMLHEQLQQVNQKLLHIAHTDSLTNLANRRRFDAYLAQEWARSHREQLPIAFLLCDIDYFKQYNDYYGHPKGDWCLQQVAQALSSVTNRPADLVARYGGEEFAILLPNTTLNGAVHLATEIQRAIARLQIPHQLSDLDQHLTLSIGIASFQVLSDLVPQQLIETADRALYAAKLGGRNRYVIGQSEP